MDDVDKNLEEEADKGASNVTRVSHKVTREERESRNGHRGGVIWLTGLSGSGKTTLAIELERRLHAQGISAYVLDGDNLRHGLTADLGFSPEARKENIRRVSEVAALFSRAGTIAISAFISPYREDRQEARRIAGQDRFHEVWVKADLATCERRDPKNLYARARSGEIPCFTGISAPYEEPENPSVVIDTAAESVDACVSSLVHYVNTYFLLTGEEAELQARNHSAHRPYLTPVNGRSKGSAA